VPRVTKKAHVQQYVRQAGWQCVGRAEWSGLRAQFPEISETTKTLDQLEASLISMAAAYELVPVECRSMVIAAKDMARFASLNGKASLEKRALKGEMVEWMLVWLGDPGMFGAWVGLRKVQINGTVHGPALL
jgi:hypothetical protein